MLRSLLCIVLGLALLAGCSAKLRTATTASQACDEALLTGRLVTSAQSGLAVQDPTGKVTEVVWPFGYSARQGVSGVDLLDERGVVVAREGDFVEITGGLDLNELWDACAGTITVVPAQG